jgi:hypothetical protein
LDALVFKESPIWAILLAKPQDLVGVHDAVDSKIKISLIKLKQFS